MKAVNGGCQAIHLLEITLISAQGLYPATRSISTYASAWVDPDHKLYTGVDRAGHTDPTWNDKFVFRVDDSFLHSDTASVDIHLHAARYRLNPLPDPLLGTVRVVLSTLRPRPGARRFAALQVRRPTSLRPHGILNLGVALLDPYVKSMPLYFDPGSPPAFAYKDLIGARRGESNNQRSPSDAVAEREKSHNLRRWSFEDGGGRLLERKGSVDIDSRVEEREREELETKLEMWKSEMSPERAGYDRRNKKKRRLSFLSCTDIDCE